MIEIHHEKVWPLFLRQFTPVWHHLMNYVSTVLPADYVNVHKKQIMAGDCVYLNQLDFRPLRF